MNYEFAPEDEPIVDSEVELPDELADDDDDDCDDCDFEDSSDNSKDDDE
jgi:hypothetical protein